MEPDPEIRPEPDEHEREAIAEALGRLAGEALHPGYSSAWRRAAFAEATQDDEPSP